jgi:hypothetical protein
LVKDAQALAEKESKLNELRRKITNLRAQNRRLRDEKEPKRRKAQGRRLSRVGEKVLRGLESEESALMARVRSALGMGAPLKSARVWHGGPVVHNKFSTDYIGTGEGNRSYGYGLYYAGKRAVGEYYRDQLSRNRGLGPVRMEKDGRVVEGPEILREYFKTGAHHPVLWRH